MKKTLLAGLAAGLLLVGMAGMASATTIGYVDSAYGNNILYSLDYTQVGSSNSYNATFSVSNDADTTPEWYAAWFTFKFNNGNTPATIAGLSGPAGPWSIMDASTEVRKGGGGAAKYESVLPASSAGFYVTSIASGNPDDDPTQGVLITGAASTSLFNFTFTTDGGQLNALDMPFQVGYYNYVTGESKFTVNRLSAELEPGTPVPEPATMLLVGTGLAGLAGARRRKKA